MNRMNSPETGTSTTREEFGLVAWLEKTRICLPLKGVECRFMVRGDLLSVELDQIFHQNNARPLDCLYTFPLPGGAAVYRCELHVNGRVIRAKVEEEVRARQIAREKNAAGYRTALVEMERENLFTLSLGNVQPGDLVVVRLAYFQTLARLDYWTSFHVPFCPGVRYIPGTPLLRALRGKGVVDDTDQVPDASRISPPRMDRLHRDAAYLSVEGVVHRSAVQDISSPSHPVLVRDEEACSTVTIAERSAVPDCDFVLRWTETHSDELSATAWLSRDGEATFALVRLRAPADVVVDQNYTQDIYFLVDHSGSMEGEKWVKAAQAFREFLKTVGPGDRVWATFFASDHRDLAEEPLPAAQLLADPAVLRLEHYRAGGGTELLPALEHLLAKVQKYSTDRPAALILITDGQVGNEAQIRQRLRPFPNLCVHTFGIDRAVNDAFLKQLASQQRGTVYLVTPDDDIAGTVARLGQRLRRPVLTALEVNKPWELAEDALPDLRAGEFVSVPLKASGTASEIVISGTRADGQEASYRFQPQQVTDPALGLLWARQRIERHLFNGERPAAITLAKTHNIICDGTAFIAWDESEKVALSAREIYQPAMEVRCCLFETIGAGAALSDQRVRHVFRSAPGTPGKVTRLFRRILGTPDTSYTEAPDLHVPCEAWKREMSAVFYDVPVPKEFIDTLCSWALAGRIEARERIEKLNELLEALQKASRSSRLKILREWIELHMQQSPDLRQSALYQLRPFEDVLQACEKR